MNEQVLKISQAVREAGGRAMLVGGCVRDQLLGFDPKDFDLEVYYLDPARLRALLKSIATVNTVGEQFAVYKLVFYRDDGARADASGAPVAAIQNPKSKIQNRFEIDVSVPRRESKSGKGHRGFVIEGDPHMSFAEAARRRDFTINAIMQDPLTGEIVDPYGGAADLQNRLLRVVAPDTFVEDSLRVLRAMQFAARFALRIEEETAKLCRTIALADLPHERIWSEMEKLLLADSPSRGLQVAYELGVLDKLFPQLRALVDAQADEARSGDAGDAGGASGNSFEQTKCRLDEAAKLSVDLAKARRLTLMLAALCLNLAENRKEERRIGEMPLPVSQLFDTLGLYTIEGYDVREQVARLLREWQKPGEFFQRRDQTRDGDFRRLAQRVDMSLLYRLAKAQMLARQGEAQKVAESTETAAEWFIERARNLGIEAGAPAPLLLGRHLLAAGMQPGKHLGEILRQVYELQLDGAVTTLEEAQQAAQDLLSNPS